MRMPNGFGTVAKLSGSRRKPYIAKKTVGWNGKGHPVYQIIGYYPTREAGLIALGKFNESPWDVAWEKATLAELFAQWLDKKAHKLGASNLSAIKTAFKHCAAIHGMRYREIKSFHMQKAVDSCGRGHGTQNHIRNLFYHLDRFALETDLITRRYSELVTVAPRPEPKKAVFTTGEVRALWDCAGAPWVDTALIFLYSGWRISELLGLRRADVDLCAGTMRGGSKTRAGRGRVVPIHSQILPLVKERCGFGGEFLICRSKNSRLPNNSYRNYWARVMERTGANHTPHDTRHTFRSRLDSAGANKVCIDLLMGHKSTDVGERVYTHKTVDELRYAVELITY